MRTVLIVALATLLTARAWSDDRTKDPDTIFVNGVSVGTLTSLSGTAATISTGTTTAPIRTLYSRTPL